MTPCELLDPATSRYGQPITCVRLPYKYKPNRFLSVKTLTSVFRTLSSRVFSFAAAGRQIRKRKYKSFAGRRIFYSPLGRRPRLPPYCPSTGARGRVRFTIVIVMIIAIIVVVICGCRVCPAIIIALHTRETNTQKSPSKLHELIILCCRFISGNAAQDETRTEIIIQLFYGVAHLVGRRKWLSGRFRLWTAKL